MRAVKNKYILSQKLVILRVLKLLSNGKLSVPIGSKRFYGKTKVLKTGIK